MFCVQDEVRMGCKCCYGVFKDLLFVHNQVMLLCLLIVDKVCNIDSSVGDVGEVS
jgi:hypothetical protein